MQISSLGARPVAAVAYPFSEEVAAQVAVLGDASDGSSTQDQLGAYTALAGRWRTAPTGERAALAQALTDSPFGQKVHATLNAFTRAAWAGTQAAPPAPQVQALAAFDALSGDDQQIVSAMQADPASGGAFASAADYRARLQSDLDGAQAAAPRKSDTITLSPEAQARLAGQAQSAAEARQPAQTARPEVAVAMAAYSRLAG